MENSSLGTTTCYTGVDSEFFFCGGGAWGLLMKGVNNMYFPLVLLCIKMIKYLGSWLSRPPRETMLQSLVQVYCKHSVIRIHLEVVNIVNCIL